MGLQRVQPRAHWSQYYVGRAYVEGEHDCVDLAAAVARKQFNLAVAPPPRAAGLRARDAQIAAVAAAHAAPVAAQEVREGDIVLMRMRGRRAAGHHLGVYCVLHGAPQVLHCMAGLGTVLHALRGLPQRGLTVSGFYRWRSP